METKSITVILCMAILFSGPLGAKTIWEREIWNGTVERAAFSRDASRTACAMADGRMIIRDLDSGEILFQQSEAPYSITGIEMSPDGDRVVWGDVSGMLYNWSSAAGVESLDAGEMALTGLALSADGTMVSYMGNGVQFRMRNAANLQSIDMRSLNLEQVHALAVDSTGDIILAGDHSGRLMRVKRSTGNQLTLAPSSEGIRGALFLSSGTSETVVWDDSGNLFFLDSDLNVISTIQLGESPTSCVVDDLRGRLIVAMPDGSIVAIDTTSRSLLYPALANLDPFIVGLGIKDDGQITAMDGFGTTWRIFEDTTEVAETPALSGQVLRGDSSVRAGIAALMTTEGGWISQLSNGESYALDIGDSGILIDAAIYHGRVDNGPVQLVLDRQTLELRLTGPCLQEDFIIDNWTPTRVVCGSWLHQIALMSSDGSVVIFEEGAEGFQEVDSADALPGTLWGDIAFINNDSEFLRKERGIGNSFPALDGPFTLEISVSGALQLSSIDSDPAFLAYPDLIPFRSGGMDTGNFGIIQAMTDRWILHREFGWGYFLPDSTTSWYWFQTEGWLAGAGRFGPFLYSDESKNWIYPLVARQASNRVYDYSLGEWRGFAAGN